MAKKKTTRPAVEPCGCGLDSSQCTGILIPIGEKGEPISLEYEDASKWRCSVNGGAGCGFAVDARDANGELVRCGECGGGLTFDPDKIGETVGGLRLKGWKVCSHCGMFWLSRRGIPTHEVSDGTAGTWKIAHGCRSLDVGGLRVRTDGKALPQQVKQLIARISRVPAFEAALERLASGFGVESLDHAIQIARDALAIADNVEQVDE